mgnify:CR=1 FL=1
MIYLKTYRYTEIADLIGGGTPKTSEPLYWDGDIPWLSVKDFVGDSKYVFSTEKHITKLGLENSSTKLLQKDDIIISARGTVGEMAMIPFPMSFNQSCFGLRANGDLVDPHFLYYYTKTKVKELKGNSHGSVFDTITRATFDNIICLLPSLEEQRRIAGILGAIDDKIENNRRINTNLELQAQALYKQWFVDFEFPNEEGKPYKTSGGKMVDSELGQIPEGWRVQTFGDLIKPQKGKNITRAQVTIGSVPVVAGGLMPSCYHNTSNTHCPVVTISASGANAGYVKMYHMPIWAADCSYIDDTISKYVHFAYVFLTYNQTSIYHKQQGCAQPHIYPSHLMELQFICPTLDILDKFESWSKKIYKLIGTNIQENETLATLRDTLLPKLMNGEIKL